MAEVKKSMFRRLLPVIIGIVLGLVIGAKSPGLIDRINGILGGGDDVPAVPAVLDEDEVSLRTDRGHLSPKI